MEGRAESAGDEKKKLLKGEKKRKKIFSPPAWGSTIQESECPRGQNLL